MSDQAEAETSETSVRDGVVGTDEAGHPNLRDPDLYANRELSWLDFNDRVLQLAEDESLPLIERLKFLAIFVTNLDEFFMVRVAGVHDQVDARIDSRGPDGMTPTEVLRGIHEMVREHDRRHAHQFSDVVRPELGEQGIKIVSCDESGAPADTIERHFREQIFPVLTPLAVGAGRPFPYISNLSLSLIVRLHDPDSDHEAFARVKVPKEVLPRFVEIAKDTFIPLEDIIARHLDALFPGMQVISHDLFRVTRDADFEVSDEANDLLQAVEDELRRRRFGEVVRLEVSASMDPALRNRLIEWLDVDEVQVYDVEGLLDLGDLMQLASIKDRPDLRWPNWTPVTQPGLVTAPGDGDAQPDLFAMMRAGDILVHYPYQSFTSSVERFVRQAVDDPNVLAIKMTVYRTSDDSALVPSLIAAAEKGKQAVCMVELKARFDERQNIRWSRELEEVGRTRGPRDPGAEDPRQGDPGRPPRARSGAPLRDDRHRQLSRQERAPVRGLWACSRPIREMGEEVANLFNTLTGYAHPKRAAARSLVAPDVAARAAAGADRGKTAAAHEAGEAGADRHEDELARRPAGDRGALPRLPGAGVPDRPQRTRDLLPAPRRCPASAETIRGGFDRRPLPRAQRGSTRFTDRRAAHVYYIGSADLMPRNLDTRVELLAPVEREELKAELADTLERCFARRHQLRGTLDADGSEWHRRTGAHPVSVHRRADGADGGRRRQRRATVA